MNATLVPVTVLLTIGDQAELVTRIHNHDNPLRVTTTAITADTDIPFDKLAGRRLTPVVSENLEDGMTAAQQPGVFLVDLDGTVALRDETVPGCRSPYDWSRVGEDLPNTPVITVVQALATAGHQILYMSGRSEECRAATGVWIAEHIGIPGEALHMRTRGDHRPDHVVKRELYKRHIKPRYKVTAVLDDRAKVVRMWRDLGLTVLQVADGDF